MSEIQARDMLQQFWLISAALAPRGNGHDGPLKFELRLIDRAFASDDQAHAVAWEAACRRG